MKIGVTGAGGFVGSHLGSYLHGRGIDVVALSRKPPPGGFWRDWRPFSLSAPPEKGLLDRLDGIIHCAWDFGATSAGRIWEINGKGSIGLLRASGEKAARKSIFLSSASAFEGCRSFYGKTKLALEKEFLLSGWLVLRPGLIFSEPAGGIYGGLVDRVTRSKTVPYFVGSRCIQRLLHADDLASAVHKYLLDTGGGAPGRPVFLAHPLDIPFADILRHIAAQKNLSRRFVPVPWQALWLAIKAGELLGLRLPFRSDSLVGLAHYAPSPDYAPAWERGWYCRPYFG